ALSLCGRACLLNFQIAAGGLNHFFAAVLLVVAERVFGEVLFRDAFVVGRRLGSAGAGAVLHCGLYLGALLRRELGSYIRWYADLSAGRVVHGHLPKTGFGVERGFIRSCQQSRHSQESSAEQKCVSHSFSFEDVRMVAILALGRKAFSTETRRHGGTEEVRQLFFLRLTASVSCLGTEKSPLSSVSPW